MSQNVNRSKNENSNEQNEGLFPHRGKMRLVEHGSPTSESLSQGCPSCENAEDTYSYDGIGNLLLSSFNAVTNAYTANCLNQYTSILCDSVTLCEPTYDLSCTLQKAGGVGGSARGPTPWEGAGGARARRCQTTSRGRPCAG